MMFSFLAVALQAAVPAPAPICTTRAAPPVGLEAWSVTAVPAAGSLRLGRPMAPTLRPVAAATFVLAPARVPKPGTFGEVFSVDIATAGTYRVALGGAAWIDVIRAGKPVESIAHAEGPACSGIRKIVDFALMPGRYTLQLSGAREPTIKVLVAAK